MILPSGYINLCPVAKKILLVDDDLYIRDLYAEVLKDESYDIFIAADGEEAMSMVDDQGPFDLVLLDVMIPKADGIQVLSKIKTDTKNKPTPVIMLTNFGQEDLVKQAINLGCADYLLKYNITPGELIAKVKQIVNPQQVQL